MRLTARPFGAVVGMVVFGIGMLWMGNIVSGLCLLSTAIFVFAVIADLPPGKFFWLALGTIIITVIFAYHAAHDEFTGTATYHLASGGLPLSESVTRAGSPEKFRAATSFLWGCSLLCGLISAICWRFHYLMEE